MIQIRMVISVTSTILLIQIWFRFDYYYFSIRYYSINKDEALAAAKALQFAADIGINQVVLEGDSQILMRALIDTESLWFCQLKMWNFILGFLINYITLILREKVPI